MTDPIVLIGGGGHAAVVAEAARLRGMNIVGHLAPTASSHKILGKWLGDDHKTQELLVGGCRFAIGVGFVSALGARHRSKILSSLPEKSLVSVVHPHSVCTASAQLGAGAFVAAGAILSTDSSIGMGALVNTGAIVDHHSSIGPNSHVATGGKISGDVTIGESCLIGAGAIIRQGITIANHAVVGAGAVVLRDIAANRTCVGNPARDIGEARG